MKDALSEWIGNTLVPSLQLWPSEIYWVLGCGAIAVVLLAGTLARLVFHLPLRSAQGLIAIAAMVFLGTLVGAALSFFDHSLNPLLQASLMAIPMALPSYFVGVAAERAEPVVREAVGMPPAAPLEIRPGGMRSVVMRELKAKHVDPDTWREAQERAEGDKDKAIPIYIGMRSRQLSQGEASGGIEVGVERLRLKSLSASS